jgi:hypothetical protein
MLKKIIHLILILIAFGTSFCTLDSYRRDPSLELKVNFPRSGSKTTGSLSKTVGEPPSFVDRIELSFVDADFTPPEIPPNYRTEADISNVFYIDDLPLSGTYSLIIKAFICNDSPEICSDRLETHSATLQSSSFKLFQGEIITSADMKVNSGLALSDTLTITNSADFTTPETAIYPLCMDWDGGDKIFLTWIAGANQLYATEYSISGKDASAPQELSNGQDLTVPNLLTCKYSDGNLLIPVSKTSGPESVVGIIKYNYSSGISSSYTQVMGDPDPDPGEYTNAVIDEKDGTIWVALVLDDRSDTREIYSKIGTLELMPVTPTKICTHCNYPIAKIGESNNLLMAYRTDGIGGVAEDGSLRLMDTAFTNISEATIPGGFQKYSVSLSYLGESRYLYTSDIGGYSYMGNLIAVTDDTVTAEYMYFTGQSFFDSWQKDAFAIEFDSASNLVFWADNTNSDVNNSKYKIYSALINSDGTPNLDRVGLVHSDADHDLDSPRGLAISNEGIGIVIWHSDDNSIHLKKVLF